MPPGPALPPQRRLLGIGLRLGAIAAFSIMAVALKLAAEGGASTIELVFYRSLFALPMVLGVIAFGRNWSVVRTGRPGAHVLRMVIGLGSMLLGFQALVMLPLAEATTIGFAAPLFATILSALVLRESVGRHRWAAVAVGLIGVIIVTQPGAAPPSPGHLVALASAVGVSMVVIAIRQIGATEAAETTVLWFTTLSVLVMGLAMPFVAAFHSPAVWGWLILLGLSGGVAQLMMTQSLRLAPVSVLAPFDYTQLVWATLFGWLIWDQGLTPTTLSGAAIVMGSGLYTVYRERRRHVAETAAEATPPIR